MLRKNRLLIPLFITAILAASSLFHAVASDGADGFTFVTNWITRGGDEVVGDWEFVQDGYLLILKDRQGNSIVNAPAAVEQAGSKIIFEWTLTVGDGFTGNAHAGLHVMAGHPKPYVSSGGDSYLIVQRVRNLALLKVSSAKYTEYITKGDFTAAPGETYTYRVEIDTTTGFIDVYRDNEHAGRWKDPEPIQAGTYVTARVRDSLAAFSNMKVKIED